MLLPQPRAWPGLWDRAPPGWAVSQEGWAVPRGVQCWLSLPGIGFSRRLNPRNSGSSEHTHEPDTSVFSFTFPGHSLPSKLSECWLLCWVSHISSHFLLSGVLNSFLPTELLSSWGSLMEGWWQWWRLCPASPSPCAHARGNNCCFVLDIMLG